MFFNANAFASLRNFIGQYLRWLNLVTCTNQCPIFKQLGGAQEMHKYFYSKSDPGSKADDPASSFRAVKE